MLVCNLPCKQFLIVILNSKHLLPRAVASIACEILVRLRTLRLDNVLLEHAIQNLHVLLDGLEEFCLLSFEVVSQGFLPDVAENFLLSLLEFLPYLL